MSNKAKRKAFAARMTMLVAEAGGLSAFCRKVWPKQRTAAAANKGKVSKWKNGLSGISPEEAEHVASVYSPRLRPAWIVFGELPEAEGISRPRAELEADIAAYVVRAAMTEPDFEVEQRIDGGVLLRRLLDCAVPELHRRCIQIKAEVDGHGSRASP